MARALRCHTAACSRAPDDELLLLLQEEALPSQTRKLYQRPESAITSSRRAAAAYNKRAESREKISKIGPSLFLPHAAGERAAAEARTISAAPVNDSP